tara:strand:+ start:2258 stop:3121 length:864 start_codon:yes stop_codon:yes gene_type:complete
MKKKTLITYIIGPTGIGKSSYAIKLAQELNAEIISADAYQVYKGMDIGTAKISKEEQKIVPHHLIDIRNPDEAYNVTDFLNYTKEIIKNTKKHIIICGGNGLFARAFLYNYAFPNAPSNPKIRKKLENQYGTGGKQSLWNLLNSIDPISASKIHPNNRHHLLRALEIFEITKKPASHIKHQSTHPRNDTKIIGLTTDKNRVINRIHTRVDSMIKQGLIEEVSKLKKEDYTQNLPALKCIGYKECFDYLNNSITLEEMIDLIKVHTQQFSKQQMTWFKKIQNVTWKTI